MRTLFALCVLSASARAQALNDYIVKPGDSCAGIARQVFGDARQWRRIGEYNPQYCGREQKVLLPGDVLRLPWSGVPGEVAPSSDVPPTEPEVTPPGADAQVTTVVRQVEAKAPEAPDWKEALRGTDLFRGWRVSTGEESSAELTFRDQSILQLRQNALVIIYGQTAQASRRPTSRARLEKGALRTRLSELAGEMTVETEAAEASVGAGVGVVEIDPAGASLVAKHEGVPAVVTAGGARVEVPAGTGSKVEKGQKPSPPRPLPPMPTWIESPTSFGPGQPLKLAWQVVEGAARYRVEISRKPDGGEPVASAGVFGGASALDLSLPPGRYHATVSVVDATGFEGRPTPARLVSLSPAFVELPGGGKPAGSHEVLVPTGSQLAPPPGFRCGPKDQPFPETLPFERATVVEITCQDAAGEALPGVTVRVEAVRARVVENPRRIKRDHPVSLRFRLESKAPLPTAIRLEAPAGLVIDKVEPAANGEFTMTFRPQASVKDAAIRVLAGDVEVSRFTLTLTLP